MSKRTFLQRLRTIALWWGVPGVCGVCAELFGMPRNLWPYMLIIAIPVTAVGVVTGAVILHAVAAHRSKASDEGNTST